MKYKSKKIITVALICILSVAMCNITFAHSGRTDSSGGHKDNKNKSGLGSYHYHCSGHPAHLHTNGVCPYSSNSSKTTKKNSKKTSKSSSSSSISGSKADIKNESATVSNIEKEAEIPTTIDAESIKINESIEEIKVGESFQLTAKILPDDTTNKEIAWKSSNENIITVSEEGKITAKEEGRAYIIVSTSNKKTDSISILVTKDKEEVKSVEETVTYENNNNNVNSSTNINSENSNPLGGFIVLGALGGGIYWGYKKFKKRKNK